MIHKKVKFQGEVYWLHGPTLDDDVLNISELKDYDENGKLLADPFNDISYAILWGDKIMCHGKQIGTDKDLEEIK